MFNKKIYLIILNICLIGLLIYFFISKSEDKSYWKCVENSSTTQEEGWIKVGNSKSNKPSIPCGERESKEAVKTFLNESLKIISPEKEVLGGKFYVTKIEWVNDSSGIVEYEDGHIALKASFDYKIEKNLQKNSYSVEITNFNIIK